MNDMEDLGKTLVLCVNLMVHVVQLYLTLLSDILMIFERRIIALHFDVHDKLITTICNELIIVYQFIASQSFFNLCILFIIFMAMAYTLWYGGILSNAISHFLDRIDANNDMIFIQDRYESWSIQTMGELTSLDRQRHLKNRTLIASQQWNLELNMEDACYICLEKYNDTFHIVQLPCKHYHHKECLEAWFENHTSCPICRANHENIEFINE